MNPAVYRQVARHLAEINRPEDALNLLGECIRAGTGVFPCLVEMADIAYRFQAWDLARDLFGRVAEVERGNPSHLLRLAHARAEGGDRDGAAAALDALRRALAEQGLPAVPEAEPFFERLYLRLCEHHREGRTETAERLLDLCVASHPFAARAAGTGTPADRAAVDALRAKLEASALAWERGELPAPAFGRAGHEARLGAPPDMRGVTVLMVMRRYFNYSRSSREHELYMMFRRTAAAAGVTLHMVEGDGLVMPYGQGWRQQAATLDACVAAINDLRPDIVVFDALCEPPASGELFGPETYRAVLGDLKRRLRFKLVGFHPDAWTGQARRALDASRGLADGWWTSSTAVFDGAPAPDRRHLNLPTPFDPSFYDGDRPGERGGARFFGSVAGYNFTRSVWLLLMERLGTPVAVTASNHGASDLNAAADYQRYADALMGSRISLNFSGRNLSTHITTGRVFESVLAGSVLLEEANAATPNFFVPFVHYVPFASAPELDAAVRLFLEDEEARLRMAGAARRWMDGNYAPGIVWRTLVGFALGLPDGRDW
jgi:hypothetical protein